MTTGTAKLSKTERKAIETLVSALDVARAALADHLRDLHSDWQAAFDARSDNWRESEAGEAAQERLDALENWAEAVEGLEFGTDGDPVDLDPLEN